MRNFKELFFAAVAVMLVFAAVGLDAQDGAAVNLSQGPPYVGYQKLFFYSGSNVQYICSSKNVTVQSTVTVTAATAANPGVFTVVGHGFEAGSAARVTVSGGTGNWAPANSIWILSRVDADTFTLRDITSGTQLNTTGFGALTGTIRVATTAPRSTQFLGTVEYRPLLDYPVRYQVSNRSSHWRLWYLSKLVPHAHTV